MKKTAILLVLLLGLIACKENESSDDKQRRDQERILAEGTAETGMPNIKNFFERKMLKRIYELRDQSDYVTYTYLYNEMNGQLIFLCDSIGYGIPSATQYTNPMKQEYDHGPYTLPQADPNGLFSPSEAEATWVLCKDPKSADTKPVYIEPRVIVSPFPMSTAPAPTPAK